MVGGAAGTLIGLVFVAVSIRVEVISRSAELRNRAAQTLGLFSSVLLVAIAIAIPDQQRWAVGIEVIVIALLTAAVLIGLDRRTRSGRGRQPISRLLDVAAPRTVTCLLLAAAGLLLLLGSVVGLYVMVVATVVASIGGVASAWLFLTRVDE